MKRILILLLVLLLCLPFTACDDKNGVLTGKGKQEETTAPDYWIIFHTNGGNNIPAVKASNLSEAPTPVKENNVFMGWYLDEGLTLSAGFPITPTGDTTLYAKWLTLKETRDYPSYNARLKDMDRSYSESCIFSLAGPAFDYEALLAQGYQDIVIHIQYDVFYHRDCAVLYVGGPKYETYLSHLQSNVSTQIWSSQNAPAPKQQETRSILKTMPLSSLRGKSLVLNFSTNNVQNVITFNNITVTYECKK